MTLIIFPGNTLGSLLSSYNLVNVLLIPFLNSISISFLGAFLGGYFYDKFGSYDNAWYLAIALSVFAALVHLPIDEKPLVRKSHPI